MCASHIDPGPPAVAFEGISKRFGGVQALDTVSLAIARGECHALMGENGAGKSTLGKILAGIHRPDTGVLRLDGTVCRFRSPRDAARAGVSMVHQELAFCPELSVAENLSLGQYPRRAGLFLDRRRVEAGDCSHWDAGRRLLINRNVEAAVFENDAAAILNDGLAYDRCTVGEPRRNLLVSHQIPNVLWGGAQGGARTGSGEAVGTSGLAREYYFGTVKECIENIFQKK